MKKKLLMCVMALTLAGVQQANAQFFKKLGKVAGAILDAASKESESSNSSSSSSSSGYSETIPHVNFKVTACEYWGDNVLVRFVATNTSSSEIGLEIDYVGVDDANAIDGDGNSHGVTAYIANGNSAGCITGTLPPDVPVKGYLTVLNVPVGCKSIDRVNFRGAVHIGNTTMLSYKYSIGQNTIEYPDNTNADNIFSSLPILRYNLNSVKHVGNNVVVTATVKNEGVNNIAINSRDGNMVFDEEGNSYEMETTVGGKELGSWTGLTMAKDIPMKMVFTIKNVPANVNKFSIIKMAYSSDMENYYVQLKNQSVL